VGVRRVLSAESIYTIKLFRRGQVIPKARHANMFLVRPARDLMERDVLVLPADTPYEDLLQRTKGDGALRHIVITSQQGRIEGVIRVNTGLWKALERARPGVTLGDVARRDFTVVDADEVVFEVIHRMDRRGAFMAVVVKGPGLPRGEDVVGAITKEHVADAVASSVRLYPSERG
jgi:CIC family chloride channel protein